MISGASAHTHTRTHIHTRHAHNAPYRNLSSGPGGFIVALARAGTSARSDREIGDDDGRAIHPGRSGDPRRWLFAERLCRRGHLPARRYKLAVRGGLLLLFAQQVSLLPIPFLCVTLQIWELAFLRPTWLTCLSSARILWSSIKALSGVAAW